MPTDWLEDEDVKLVTHYESRGSLWEGWKLVLPDRSSQEIRRRAKALQINQRSLERAREIDVLSLMKTGASPSRIDTMLGCKPGTAHDTVVTRWVRTNPELRGV